MSVLSIPNLFTTGTTIQAAPFNQNFTAVQTAVNNVDNTNIGAAGLFASNLIPTTSGNATFGGLVGYIHAAPSAGITPLTVAGFAGQSVDIFDVTLTSGGAKALFVTSAGALNVGAAGQATTAGDVGISRGASTAELIMGGGSSSVTLDYGLTTASVLTANKSFVDTGAILAGNVSNIATVVAGDMSAARSATGGGIWLGGTTPGFIDWNLVTANQISFSNGAGLFRPFSAGAYTNASDISFKTKIAPIAGSLALISRLKPSSFVWIADDSNDIGFVAQDIAAIMPDAITTFADGTLGYKPVAILAHLVSAFQQYVATHP